MRAPQYVWGINPYSVGQMLEYFCGRSTFKKPLFLSISYLTVSVGTVSIYVLTISGASLPMEIPCQGWERSKSARDCQRLVKSLFIYRLTPFSLGVIMPTETMAL